MRNVFYFLKITKTHKTFKKSKTSMPARFYDKSINQPQKTGRVMYDLSFRFHFISLRCSPENKNKQTWRLIDSL